jgi:hypothetical protein
MRRLKKDRRLAAMGNLPQPLFLITPFVRPKPQKLKLPIGR